MIFFLVLESTGWKSGVLAAHLNMFVGNLRASHQGNGAPGCLDVDIIVVPQTLKTFAVQHKDTAFSYSDVLALSK